MKDPWTVKDALAHITQDIQQALSAQHP